jgi:SAM-dependent methyltransferase
MTAEKTTPTARAAETLRRGPGAAPPPGPGPRGLVRRTLLRVLRPYTHHQHELDGQLVAALRDQQAAIERHAEQIERLEELARELILTAESLRRASADAAEDAALARRAVEPLAAELYAPPYMAGDPFELQDSLVGEVLGFRAGAGVSGSGVDQGERSQPHAAVGGTGSEGDADYVAFEQLFRGPAERVAELQRPYLALVRDHEPVLDVGCGRGEFLALLRAEGIAGRGVDSDAGMSARCQALGLDVRHGDANEHLDGLPDHSLGTIFSAQVIEHMPHTELRRLLELSLRKLAPGGLFIAETVNPHRISSLKTFWVDLTHQHPIFPEVALAICAIAGFQSAFVFAPGSDSFERARYDSPAYAVVAAAPDAGVAAAPGDGIATAPDGGVAASPDDGQGS